MTGHRAGHPAGHWRALLAASALVIGAFSGTFLWTSAGSATGPAPAAVTAPAHAVLAAQVTPVATLTTEQVHLAHLAHEAHLKYLAEHKTAAAPAVSGIAAYARSFAGPPHYYLYGGEGPYGFDCSGLAQVVYAHFGLHIPRTSEEQAASVTRVSGPQPGDLVSYWSGGDAYHSAIYLGGGMVVSALNPASGIMVTPVSYPGSSYSYGAVH